MQQQQQQHQAHRQQGTDRRPYRKSGGSSRPEAGLAAPVSMATTADHIMRHGRQVPAATTAPTAGEPVLRALFRGEAPRGSRTARRVATTRAAAVPQTPQQMSITAILNPFLRIPTTICSTTTREANCLQ